MTVENTHAPYLYENENTDTIIIFIHGIMGSPNQFKSMMSVAGNRGYSVSAILLPGHGGTVKDFAKSNRFQWCAAVREHIELMSGKYENIVLAGHSMGSLLAFSSYIHYPEQIKGIIAIAAPLKIAIKPRAIRTSCAVASGKCAGGDAVLDAAYNACSVKSLSIWDYICSVPRFVDLLLLVRSTRKKLVQIKAPSLIVHSLKDEIVSPRSAAGFEKNLYRCKTLKLERSGHYYYPKEEQCALNQIFIEFLDTI